MQKVKIKKEGDIMQKVKIKNMNNPTFKQFSNVSTGQYFEYEGHLYIKLFEYLDVDNDVVNVWNLSLHCQERFYSFTTVKLISEIKIEYKL